MRFALLSLLLVLTVACGSAGNEPAGTAQPAGDAPQGNALTTGTPGAAAGPAGDAGTTASDRRLPADSGSASSSPRDTRGTVAAAAPAAGPTMMPMNVPSGTELHLILETPLSSETAEVEQTVRARVSKPVVIDGMTVIPEGAPVRGTVVAAERSGRVKGLASVALRFNQVTVGKTPYRITTARIVRQAEATKGEDATKIGIGAGVGTAIGAIAGGKKGAAIGAGIGGGAGTGAVLATRGKEVTLPAGTTLRTTVQETVRITAQM
jgi:hypothetical protein